MSRPDTQPHVASQPHARAVDAGTTGGSFLAAIASYHGDSHAVALVGALLLMLAAYCSMWSESSRRAKRRRGAPQKFSTPAMYRTRSKEMLVSLVPVPEKALLTNRELRSSSVPQCSFYPPPTCDDEEEDERRVAAEEEEYEGEDACGEAEVETGAGAEVEVEVEVVAEHRREAHAGTPLATAAHGAATGVVVTQPCFARTEARTKTQTETPTDSERRSPPHETQPSVDHHKPVLSERDVGPGAANDDADMVAFVAVAGGDSGVEGGSSDGARLGLLRDEGTGAPQRGRGCGEGALRS